MDVQDFMIQGEGHEEDKREAWTLFQQAYGHQMKGELEEAVNLYKKSLDILRDRGGLYVSRLDLQFHGKAR